MNFMAASISVIGFKLKRCRKKVNARVNACFNMPDMPQIEILGQNCITKVTNVLAHSDGSLTF